MRGIRKSRSPEDVGKVGHAELALVDAAADLHALLRQCPPTEHHERARSAFEDLERSKLRPILLADQYHLCVYCEAEVVDDPADPPPVEHWEPVRATPHQALDWDNLYLSCKSRHSCDAKKGGKRLAWDDADPSLPPPCQFGYEHYIGFGNGGDIYVKQHANLTSEHRRALELALDDRDLDGTKRESILGLNHADLRAARKAVMDRERSRIDRRFPKSRAPSSEFASRVRSLLGLGRRESFVSARVAWLEGSVGKDRP